MKQNKADIMSITISMTDKQPFTAKVFKPYWNDSCVDISSLLLSHIGIDSLALDSTLSSSWLNKTVENSWFSTKLNTVPNRNLPPILSQFYTSSLAECIDSEAILKKSKKIRIYATSKQKSIFKKWFGVQRLVYNLTIDFLNNIDGARPYWMIVAKIILAELPIFCKEVPYQIKKIAIKEDCQAISAGKIKANKTGIGFKLKFKSRKKPVQSCYISKSAISINGIYPTLTGMINYTENLPDDICDSRLLYHNGRYYLAVPYKTNQTLSENQGRVCSIDPGVRSFLTFYSDFSFGHIGQSDFSRIQRLCEYLDALISKSVKSISRKRKYIKQAIYRMRWKIKDLVKELHCKTARFLIDNFDIFLLPTFETQQMTNRVIRKIRRKSVRSMLTFAHFKFKNRLKNMAFENGKTIIDVSEAYTSKTNSFNGEMKNIGGAKKIRISKNKWVDRDYNGARGILVKFLSENPIALGD